MNTLERAMPAYREKKEGAVVLRNQGDGRLMALRGENLVAIKLRQCFPWSEPTRHISLRDTDDKEIALVDDPSSLDAESRKAFELALAEAGFVLEVTRVMEIEEEIEIRQWTVETKQGNRSFQTHLDDWPRVLPGGGLLIRDVAGDLYRLANPSRLDKKSRALLWAFVD